VNERLRRSNDEAKAQTRVWFEEFEKASPEEKQEMLAQRKAGESRVLSRRLLGEPEQEQQLAPEDDAEAREWLERVRGGARDLDLLVTDDEETRGGRDEGNDRP